MQKIKEIFNHKSTTISFELFPPKTDKGFDKLRETIIDLAGLEPDFFSCTYGAGGGNRDKTLDIVQHIEQAHQIVSMAHLTCVLHTKDELKKIISDIQQRGIKNILALRGDPPTDQPDWTPGENNFKYSSELAGFIKEEFDDHFCIGVAGFPEGHILCKDRDKDAGYLKAKIDAGADFVITQIFFDNSDYFDYLKRLGNLGVSARVLPGILPITDYEKLQKFCNMCGASVTDNVKEVFEPIKDDPEAVKKAGIEFAIHQCKDLLASGAPGLHFYTLNKLNPTKQILDAIRS